MRFLYGLLIEIVFINFYHAIIVNNCRFVRTFYQTHSNIFQLDKNQTFLTVRPLHALSNQSFSSLSIGIIYRLANTYLVPVPLLFECSQNKRIYTPIDCEFTIIDTRSDLSIRTTESTRTKTVSLYFKEYSSLKSSLSIRGAYFKQSTIAIQNCRLSNKENFFIKEIFHINIKFEQIINSSCQYKCLHSQLYECSSLSNTCQCRSNEIGIEKFGHLCIDTELGSNCSITPERCRRICRISDKNDFNCQCPLGTQRIFSNNIYHCQLPILPECNNEKPILTCPHGYICRQNQCIQIYIKQSILSLPFLLIILLVSAFLIIIILIIILIKMRSIKSIKFIHPHILSNNSSSITITHLSSPCSTISSSSKLTYEK